MLVLTTLLPQRQPLPWLPQLLLGWLRRPIPLPPARGAAVEVLVDMEQADLSVEATGRETLLSCRRGQDHLKAGGVAASTPSRRGLTVTSRRTGLSAQMEA